MFGKIYLSPSFTLPLHDLSLPIFVGSIINEESEIILDGCFLIEPSDYVKEKISFKEDIHLILGEDFHIEYFTEQDYFVWLLKNIVKD